MSKKNKRRRNSGEELLAEIDNARSKTVNTETVGYGGSVDQSGDLTGRKRKFAYVKKDNVVETGTRTDILSCSFGHMLQGGKLILLGECHSCQSLTCSMPGCHFVCAGCGHSFCRRHVTLHGNEAYCSRCNWTVYWWRKFWGLD